MSFQNSWYIFTKKGENWTTDRGICQSQGGDLVSIETEEEWNFIGDEIQNRSTMSNCSRACKHHSRYDKWYIGLEKKGENWTWVNGKLVNMSKWAGEPECGGTVAHICKQTINGTQSLFCDIPSSENSAYICEIPIGKKKITLIFVTKLSKGTLKALMNRNANIT